jgi:hypothetical protein
VLDTGAMGGVFKRSSAKRAKLEINNKAPDTIYLFGTGDARRSHESVQAGITGGHIIEDAVDNLVGINDFMDAGSYLYVDRAGGLIGNKKTKATIPIWRQGLQYRVWLSDVKNYHYVEPDEWARQTKMRRDTLEDRQRILARVALIKKGTRKLGFRRKHPKKPGRLRVIRDMVNKERHSSARDRTASTIASNRDSEATDTTSMNDISKLEQGGVNTNAEPPNCLHPSIIPEATVRQREKNPNSYSNFKYDRRARSDSKLKPTKRDRSTSTSEYDNKGSVDSGGGDFQYGWWREKSCNC